MKIFILGNIASGKSRLIHDLKNLINISSSVLQIDDFRHKFSDASNDGEDYARQRFIRSVITLPEHSESLAFIELTGFGKLGKELLDELRADQCKKLAIFLFVPLDILLNRIDETEVDKTRTPFPGGVNSLRQTARSIDTLIQNSFFMQAWLKLPNCTWVSFKNDSQEAYQQNLLFIRSLLTYSK